MVHQQCGQVRDSRQAHYGQDGALLNDIMISSRLITLSSAYRLSLIVLGSTIDASTSRSQEGENKSEERSKLSSLSRDIENSWHPLTAAYVEI